MTASSSRHGRRAPRRLAIALIGALLALGGVVAARPAPARAATDYPLEGEWRGFPWNPVTFVGSSGYLPGNCGPRKVYQNLSKAGENHWTGQMATVAGSDGTCITDSAWFPVDILIVNNGTELRTHVSANPPFDWGFQRIGPLVQRCPSLQTKTVRFLNYLDGNRGAFSVSFTNLNYCYDWKNVWFRDNPQYRIYVGAAYSSGLQGACNGASKTDTNVRLPSIYVTCNAAFSRKSGSALRLKAEGDRDGSSVFDLPMYLNAGVNFGPFGFLATAVPADQVRYYTLRLYANGCYNVSGIGNSASTCP
jgi:hypothetical protein